MHHSSKILASRWWKGSRSRSWKRNGDLFLIHRNIVPGIFGPQTVTESYIRRGHSKRVLWCLSLKGWANPNGGRTNKNIVLGFAGCFSHQEDPDCILAADGCDSSKNSFKGGRSSARTKEISRDWATRSYLLKLQRWVRDYWHEISVHPVRGVQSLQQLLGWSRAQALSGKSQKARTGDKERLTRLKA